MPKILFNLVLFISSIEIPMRNPLKFHVKAVLTWIRNTFPFSTSLMSGVLYIEDLTRVDISYEIYETSLRRVS